MITVYIPVGRNMGHSNFCLWLDQHDPHLAEICWRTLENVNFQIWFAEEQQQGPVPTAAEMAVQFHFEDRRLIRQLSGFDSTMVGKELYLIVPIDQLGDFAWEYLEELPTE
jgi:hypothetical protein